VHYRKPVNYSEGALQTAKNTIKKIHMFICRLNAVNNDNENGFAEIDQLIYDLKHDFVAALDDDLNIAGALSALFNFIGKINLPLTQGVINRISGRKVLTALESINEVLGIMDFKEPVAQGKISELIDKREAARSVHNWEEADLYRIQLGELGVDILDTPQGVVWRFK
jgi:cysteinyl-tRNA synthetase